jgi:hypothetical protein
VTRGIGAAVSRLPWRRVERGAVMATAIAGSVALAFHLGVVANVLLIAFAILVWRTRRVSGAAVVSLVIAVLTIVVVEAIEVLGAIADPTTGADPAYALAAILFLAFAYVVWRDDPGVAGAGMVSLILVLAALGFVEAAAPTDVTRAIGDGFVTCALLATIVYFAAALVDRARRDARPLRANWARIRADAVDALAGVNPRGLRRIAWAVGLTLGVLALGSALGAPNSASGWKMVGARDGAPVWNAAFLAGSLRPEAAALRDDRIVGPAGAAPRVGIADAPLLTALKRIAPGSWDGVRFVNLLSLADLWLCLIAAVWFVAKLSGTRGGAMVAVGAAFATTPVLPQVQLAAPFDLWPALLLASFVAGRPVRWAAPAVCALGFLNVADGYEFALLAFGLAVAGLLTRRAAIGLALLAVAGSVLAALLSRVLAPDATSFATWWSTNDIVTLGRSLDVHWGVVSRALCAIAIVAGWGVCLWARDRALHAPAAMLAVAAIIALPPVLGGVPLVVPSRLLEALPLGWPSARFVEIALLLAFVPLAIALRRLRDQRFRRVAPVLRWAAQVALILFAFGLGRTAAPHVIAPFARNTVVVEVPVSESRSRAAVLFSDELLESGARIVQPIPYVATDALIGAATSFDAALDALQRFAPASGVIVREDVYTDPLERYAEPRILDAADFAVPDAEKETRLKLRTITEQAQVYDLGSGRG